MRHGSGGESTNAWILAEPSSPPTKIWGLATTERLQRALVAAGIPREHIVIGQAPPTRAQGNRVLIVRSDYVFDERLIRALAESHNTALISPALSSQDAKIVAVHTEAPRLKDVFRLFQEGDFVEAVARGNALHCVEPEDLVPAYTASLRKADPPYLLPVEQGNVKAVEARIFQASYKGITDLVTKWVWPRPAYVVTRWLAHAGIHPNAVTLLSWVLVVLTALLFSKGYFGFGLIVAWLMTFLDTVDGKLARVTLTSSSVGHVLDHGLDIVHPPFWYLAWSMGLPASAVWVWPTAVITVGGYIGRLIEGLFLLAFKMEIHSWRPIDSYFRTITARRNPNLILLMIGTFIGRPDLGLVFVAFWTVFSIAFHTARLVQAFTQRWRGRPIHTWQESGTLA
jgi:phosphatidylglycerophosphate synthase